MEARMERTAPAAASPRVHPLTLFALLVTGSTVLLLYDRALLFLDFFNVLYASTLTLAVGAGLGLAVGALALVMAQPGWLGRSLLILGMLALAAFPLLMPVMYPPYELNAQPAEGHELVWLTEPQGRWASALKSAQLAHEKTGCEHTLHGWDAVGALVYGSSCGGLWRADPAAGGPPEALAALPASLDSAAVDRGTAHDTGSRLYPQQPAELDASPPHGFITVERALSPDGGWWAVVVSPFYGPADVLLVSR